MSREFASVVLFYDGHLAIDDNFILTFTRGRARPLKVPVHLKLDELKNKIKSSLRIGSSIHSISLTCNYPFGSSFIATSISDDEVCGVILEEASRQTLGIYVEVKRCETSYSAADNIVVEPRNTVEYAQCTISLVETNTIPPRSSGILESGQTDRYVLPREAVVDDYETVDSSSSTLPENFESVKEIEFAETDINDVIQGHHLIREHSLRNVQEEDDMILNNDYVNICQTTRESDADEVVHEPSHYSLISDDIEIPTELLEGMCFATKKQLQFAITGWSIYNNVQYVPTTSNQRNFTVVCAQHDNPNRACKWRVHCSSSKRLGGAWRISKITGSHSCVNVASSHGHPQCTSKFIAYFILPALRGQIDMKPQEIIELIESKFNISVSYMKAWDARRKAIKTLFGSCELRPPPSRRRMGRPRTNRFQNTMDEDSSSSRRRCGLCNNYGHYRRTCPHNV